MKLFAKRFYGFNPEVFPIVTFSRSGSRSSLLRRSAQGDRILYVAVKGEEAAERERGRILGMSEFSRDEVDSEDYISDPSSLPRNYYNADGTFRWSQGIPVISAWRFSDPPLLTDIMPQLGQEARSSAVLLDPIISENILQLPHYEVDIPKTKAMDALQKRRKTLSTPLPMEWRFELNRIAKRVLSTAKGAHGQEVTTVKKIKNCDLSEGELELLLRSLFTKQKGLCAITGRKLKIRETGNDWLAASVDRIDSDGHYEENNIQLVTWAANRAKGDLADDQVEDFFNALQNED